MTLNEKLTIVALVIGPAIAVGISLWIEARRRTQETRLRIIRMLLATRHMPAHQDYCAAINLVPLEFNDQEKVMKAWAEYHERVRQDPNLLGHEGRVRAAQSTLIYQAMICTGLKLSEADIQTQAYVSEGFVKRDEIYIKSLQAMPEIAEAMKAQVEHTRQMMAGIAAAAQKANNQPATAPPQLAAPQGNQP